jgi:RNA methyltransferase, RsmD family
LRIIAGKSRGRRLETVSGIGTRPTSDRVKEALFNIIQMRLTDSIVLDLFAGTGNLGLEAISRGSRKAVFVEKDRNAIAVLNRNCKTLGYLEQIEIIPKDVLKALTDLSKRDILFDIIFIDPPYQKGYEEHVLASIDEGGILEQDGIITVEHDKNIMPPNRVGNLVRFDERVYGRTGISFYRKD